MTGYTDGYWWSPDGLRLHYRDYIRQGADDGRPPLLCLPGLTRNARDFEPLAERLSGQWRLICPDMRGRAESAYAKDAMSYVPLTYLQDISRLLADLAITRFVAIGTSLGGILTMLIAATHREWLAGALLNDVGPALDPAGLDRIRSYVGVGQSHPTWVHAARALADANGDVYPRYGLEQWIAMAKRLYRLNSGGRIVLDYDMKIAEPIRAMGSETGVDMWPVMPAFGGIPTLLLRGARSDLLSADNALRMARDIGESAELVTVPDVGHAPVLDEPESLAAIDRLLDRVLRG
ncbi:MULTISPECIES: alpha/beta fold hydrolase [Sphingobium]|uniref:alpha/beta fold hydrolase n=1 Tax=Sphingobium TaxID=165695 RepID=UPI000C49A227|nr:MULTISPECIES: alpha/beta hydrolase [Sphingobium]MAP44766.1 alpha/beta hydrolase [Sphingobium sp.]MEC9017999.1 alpha/beta hydrolase [Pseudomonadota bacterium]MBA38713.1 alpha/beta hydrolase [Sphingobium sp.]MBS47911.1 alpha/beta hydrolase [Sphingobium sp.]MCC4255617.1 alpha/beta hydrolase [Sphingobium lactosutens]